MILFSSDCWTAIWRLNFVKCLFKAFIVKSFWVSSFWQTTTMTRFTSAWLIVFWFYCISTIVDYLYIYIEYIRFGFVWFYGISTSVGYLMPNPFHTSRLNFWDDVWWFLSLRVFGLLSSSLLLFPQRFGRYVLQPYSGICRTQEPSRNFELRPLLNQAG